MKIHVFPKLRFDAYMRKNGWNDSNVPSNCAFISICCTPEIREKYLKEIRNINDFHLFSDKHENVLNIEFDDITSDKLETIYGIAYGITDEQAQQIVDFAKNNADKEHIYIHCMAGKSRSVAVGIALKEYFGCDFGSFYGSNNLNKFVYNKLAVRL